MANSLEQIHTQAKINTAIGVVQIAQTAAMNAKLRRLNKAQEESNAIQKQIAQINLYIAEEQRQQTELSTKSLSEQVRQTELQETQVKLSKFKIELDIHEKKEEKANKERLSNMMEVVFHAPKELETIKSSEKHKIEKYFEFQTLKINCLMAGVSTEGVDDFESKKYISEFLDLLTDCIDDTLKLDDEEEKDLIDILDILSVDEEQLINKEKKEIKNIDKELLGVDQEIQEKEKLIKNNEKKIAKLESKT